MREREDGSCGGKANAFISFRKTVGLVLMRTFYLLSSAVTKSGTCGAERLSAGIGLGEAAEMVEILNGIQPTIELNFNKMVKMPRMQSTLDRIKGRNFLCWNEERTTEIG